MASARKGVHVVKGPNDRQGWRKFAEEISVVNESCNPMEVQYIARWQLSKNIRAMLTAVIAEKDCASCPS
jgi:hypothetical protein